MRDYKNIKAFQFANDLVLELYKATKNFPKEESYGLTSQIRRAAVSVVANIAEGASRQHKNDYLNFLFNARGSLAETECLLRLAYKLDYLDKIAYECLDKLRIEAAKTLYGLIDAVSSEVLGKS